MTAYERWPGDYDHVVVGAGTAGCVVAARLAQAGRKVLLLEAGVSDWKLWVQIPIGYGRTYADKRVNWMYETEPVPGLGGRTSYWPRGKVVGGSGSINAMVHVRGQPGDYDDWAALGNTGWGWDDVLPVFIRAEDSDIVEPGWRGQGGPQHVSDMRDRVHSLCQRFIATGEALGYPECADFNGSRPEGFGVWQINTRRGWRASTANAWLHPALATGRIDLQTGAHVTQVVIEQGRAVGVRLRQHGRWFEVRPHGEVVLAGGAINSPQLLQLSGVGDPARLQALGIAPVHALPAVGVGLQDHLAISYIYKSRVPTLNNQLAPLWGKMLAALRYAWDRQGPLAGSVNQAGGFVRTDPALPRPDIQLYFSPVSYTRTVINERRIANPDRFPAFLLSFNPCRPTSRGWVHVRSSDPFAAPAIQPDYLSTAHDRAQVHAGVALMQRLIATSPLADVLIRQLTPATPDKGGPATPDDWYTDFVTRADTVYHPTSTCRMGPDPTTSLVTPRLTVHGLERLRVIDASVFPTVTSGNTNAPTVMVAEKGAAMMLADTALR